jgi:hypothetical protein
MRKGTKDAQRMGKGGGMVASTHCPLTLLPPSLPPPGCQSQTNQTITNKQTPPRNKTTTKQQFTLPSFPVAHETPVEDTYTGRPRAGTRDRLGWRVG